MANIQSVNIGIFTSCPPVSINFKNFMAFKYKPTSDQRALLAVASFPQTSAPLIDY